MASYWNGWETWSKIVYENQLISLSKRSNIPNIESEWITIKLIKLMDLIQPRRTLWAMILVLWRVGWRLSSNMSPLMRCRWTNLTVFPRADIVISPLAIPERWFKLWGLSFSVVPSSYSIPTALQIQSRRNVKWLHCFIDTQEQREAMEKQCTQDKRQDHFARHDASPRYYLQSPWRDTSASQQTPSECRFRWG